MAERCVCCGEIIPEGQQVCPSCKKGERKMAELKPCPFCGDGNIGVMTMLPFHNELVAYYVCCFRCGARTAAHIDEQYAIEAWNGRAEDGK